MDGGRGEAADIGAHGQVPSPGAAQTENGSPNQLVGNQDTSLSEDPNPRSPKRRRLDPLDDDAEIDFEAAAARALAISLGENDSDPTPPPARLNGTLSNVRLPQKSPPGLSPTQQARIVKLPALDAVAVQVLNTLARMAHGEIGEMLFGPPSEAQSEYQKLRSKFSQAKHIYLPVPGSYFISPQSVGLNEATQVDILRRTNMATFMASIFSGEIGLRIMDMNFVDVFVPENGRLLKAQASIYLELKTQAFIAAKRTQPEIVRQAMSELFPPDMEKPLLAKRPGAKSLAPSEHDFLKRLKSRRDILYADIQNNRLEGLENRYRWDDFSREVYSYLSKNNDQSNSANKDKSEQPSPSPAQVQLQQDQMQGQFAIKSQPPSQVPNGSITGSAADVDFDLGFDIDSFVAKAARAAELAMQGNNTSSHEFNPASSQPESEQQVKIQSSSNLTPTASDQKPHVISPAEITFLAEDTVGQVAPLNHTEFHQYQPVTNTNNNHTQGSEAPPIDGDVPHKSQTAPTQVLYERARLVTTAKVSPAARKPNPPSHRRPWTHEEENALMTGLDQVKGPHWSQILAMYGPGGTINESLKDRNQVQLKDKARNLKLFFLKAGIEVPYYLQAVTGDLKTRAPGQAEKREAKERERVNTDGDDSTMPQDEMQAEFFDDADASVESGLKRDEDIDHSFTNDSVRLEQPETFEDGARESQVEDSETNVPSGELFVGTESITVPQEDAFDMEAMLARAAASVTQSLGNGWP